MTNPTLYRMMLRTGIVLYPLWLLGCSSIPKYDVPKVETANTFKEGAAFDAEQAEAAKLFKPAKGVVQTTPDAWWELFNDPVLNNLQLRANVGNPNLAVSAANVKLAMAAAGTASAALFPTVNVGGGLNRANVVTAGAPIGTTYSATGSFSSWELDVWDRLGAAAKSAKLKEVASVATLASARLSLQASVAQTYFSLRSAEALQAVQAKTITAYTKSLELTQNRFVGGIASSADVAQAQSQLASAKAQAESSGINRAQLEHALAALLGESPSGFSLPATAALPAVPVVALQVPSNLLERRPDIAAAERTVAAANASIGAADAAFFPALTLSANTGYRSGVLGGLIALPNRIWSVGPNLTYALFDGGARKAASASARATYEQAVATYKQTVIVALQEVEDNLVAAAGLAREEGYQQAALDAARKSLDVTNNQYKAGVVSYLNVVTAQSTELSAQSNLLTTQSARLTALSILLKNLAGRWDAEIKPAQPAAR